MALIQLSVVLGICHVLIVTSSHNSCDYAADLSYPLARDPDSVVSSTPICDSWLIPGWYRVKHSVMVKTPPMFGRCGTTYPIWANGSDPEFVNDTVTFVACQVGFYGPCDTSYTIMATRCSMNDVIYYLQDVSACHAAYCFELDDSCVKETVSDVNVIYHNTTWEILTEIGVKTYHPTLNFLCAFSTLNFTDLYYNIEWYIGDNFVKHVSVNESELDQAILTSEDMIKNNKKMGEKIRCVVGAKRKKELIPCLTKSSLHFTVGFEILNKTIDLKRGGNCELQIKQTIPYVIRSPVDIPIRPNDLLFIRTKYKDSGVSNCQQVAGKKQKCGFEVNGYSYPFPEEQSAPWDMIHTLSLTSLDPTVYYIKDHRLLLSLGTAEVIDGNAFFSDVNLSDIYVNIVDDIDLWKGKRCSSYADPHMTTFDGYPYECHKRGCESGKTFLMYENKQHNQQVQVRHGSCWGRPQCVCAVAARAGRDVFIIDFCNGQEFIDFPQCDDRSLQVHREGDFTYRIVFPTGTSVKAYLYDDWDWDNGRFWYVNVEIYPTIADFNATTGLCGYLDDDQTNDLTWNTGFKDDIQLYDYYKSYPDKFSQSWGVTNDSENLLSRNHAIFESFDGLASYTQKLCHCDQALGTVCSYKRFQNCKTTQWGPTLPCHIPTSNRKRRDVRVLGEKNHVHTFQRIRRQKRQTTKTQEEATSLCEIAFQLSAHYETCLQNIPNFSNETLINCINDLMMTGNENLTELHVETALNQCKEYISYNSTLQTEKSNIVIEILALCPKNCSNNGVCFNGNCTCEKGYGGSDCSFDLSEPPTISRISGDGICDKSLDDCNEILIYGRYFVKNPNASCVIIRKEVDANGTIFTNEAIKVSLHEITLFEASCALIYETSESWFTEFVFNVTNDGEQFTEKHSVYIYQSQCQTLTNESGIVRVILQSGYCYINGSCIQSEAFKSNSSCLQCKPMIDSFNWSGCSTEETSFETTLSTKTTTTASHLTTTISSQVEELTKGAIALIIGVIVASMVTLLATVYLIKWKLIDGKSKKHSLMDKGNLDDVRKCPVNNISMTWKGNFNSVNLFHLESKADKYARPSSALSNRAMSPTNDLNNVVD